MTNFPGDIYTEPAGIDVDTLRNLGPLRALAGIWQGESGLDVKPKADGPRSQAFVERMELQPIDPQTNGPQLFMYRKYGMSRRQGRRGATVCVITSIPSNPGKSKPITNKWAIGNGNRRPAPCCKH